MSILTQDTGVAAAPASDRIRGDKPRQRLIALTVVAAVIVLDQAVKWWAWRHVSGVRINAGGDVLVGPTIGKWYAEPVTGALLDLLDFGLLSVALFVLVRRRRPAAVEVFGALMLAAGPATCSTGWDCITGPLLAVSAEWSIHPRGRNPLQRRGPVHHWCHAAVPTGCRLLGGSTADGPRSAGT